MSHRTFVLVAALAAALFTTGVHANTVRPMQASRIDFIQITRVCSQHLLGSYVVVHDADKMAAGEPCTTFYKLRAGKAAEEVVSFRCIPKHRTPVAKTTITVVPTGGITTTTSSVELIEFQLAGYSEAHGVPPFETPR